LSEATHAGVPLVLFPQANDQFPLSELMAERGVAVLLAPKALSARAIRDATDRAMNDLTMRERCRDLRARLRADGSGAQRAADLVLAALARSKQPVANAQRRGP
jgi:UDP:flavonoid glycosyltransferase YjiC (YdhE family)